MAGFCAEKVRWDPYQYIVSGTYCDTATICSQLRCVARAGEADAAIVLVTLAVGGGTDPGGQGRTVTTKFFQSLLLFCHRDSTREREIQRQLMSPLPQFRLDLPSADCEGCLSGIMGAALKHGPFEMLAREFGDSAPVRYLSLDSPRAETSEVCSGVLLLRAGNAIRPDALLFDLKVMICASAPIVVHRNLRLIDNAEKAMRACEERAIRDHTLNSSPAPDSTAIDRVATALLNAAVGVTRSETGLLYLATGNSRRLTCRAAVNMKPRVGEILLDRPSGYSYLTIAADVFQTRRPLLVNREVEGEGGEYGLPDRWIDAEDRDRGSAVLAVPIMQPSSDPSESKVLGVITVQKDPGDPNPYTANDLIVLRNIALHFCLRHWETMTEITNARMASLTTAQFGAVSPESEAALQSLIDPRQIQQSDPLIPIEYYLASDQLISALRDIRELTWTKTATIRLLSRSGFYLVRFCALPAEAMDDPYRVIELSDAASVSAWVARNGKECYLADLKGPKPLSGFAGLQRPRLLREKVVSVFCVPIFVRSRLVGTLYVESEYQGAFHSYKHLIRGIAEQIRLALLRTQSLAEQMVLSAGARMTLNTHELLKCYDALSRLRGDLEVAAPTLLEGLDRVQVKLANCLDQYGDDRRTTSKSRRFVDVVTETVEQKGVGPFCVWRSDLSRTGTQWISATTANALRLALGEVLDNSILAAARVAHSELTLQICEYVRGGCQYLALRVKHPLRGEIPLPHLARMYRVPIMKEDRLHLGAFLAGAVIRAVGGDMWISVDQEQTPAQDHAYTTLEVQREQEL